MPIKIELTSKDFLGIPKIIEVNKLLKLLQKIENKLTGIDKADLTIAELKILNLIETDKETK